jgi:hypothetical protein
MSKLTEADVLEKMSHLAMKVFPPQTQLKTERRQDGWTIQVRWKSQDDPASLSETARGVDLIFPGAWLAQYSDSDVEAQLKWDQYVEDAVTERLKKFDPYRGGAATQRIEDWAVTAAASDRGS